MTFKQYFTEAFVSPFISRSQKQLAVNTGPDQGKTVNDINNTFPSQQKTVRVVLPKKKRKRVN
jgi:hypothetical protein